MKVALICNSDLLGGAAIVTFRLMQALRLQGVDARMIVYTKLSDSPQVEVVGSRFVRGVYFMWERLRIYAANGFSRDDLFKVSIANVGYPIHRHPWVKESDVVALNWINQGLASLDGIRKLGRSGKPIVWTMHDMWNCTGICHHAYECTRYRESCGKCPFLGSDKPDDLSHKVWLRKKELYNSVPIHFVAVSNWLADRCAASSLLRNRSVSVIPNAFPVETFATESATTPMLPGIDFRRDLILMGAARLDDPIKGIEYAISALNTIFDNNPEVSKRSMAVFFGNLNNPGLLDSLRFPHIWVGRINDPALLRSLYACAKVVLSTSLYETLPGTLIEGQASGCVPVSFGLGGQRDIVTHKKDGYIARYKDPEDIANGIVWALGAGIDRRQLHESVSERFAASSIAARYIRLFEDLINK
ncbi:MAG: glycosyltransferase [Muribaculaceae bacterium]|jgi:glycosyltransferase involved in cell wall biosynthesis|nr:glycosyltransferase [Muribaculaceae bacterium]